MQYAGSAVDCASPLLSLRDVFTYAELTACPFPVAFSLTEKVLRWYWRHLAILTRSKMSIKRNPTDNPITTNIEVWLGGVGSLSSGAALSESLVLVGV